MDTSTQTAYLDLMREALAPEPAAFTWFCELLEYILAWDHAADGDEIDRYRSDTAFEAALLHWPHNEWYRQNSRALTLVLANAVQAWRYGVYRPKEYDGYTEVACSCVLLVRGWEGLARYSARIRAIVYREMVEDNVRDNQ